MAVRGVRGATTAAANTAEEIIEATQELIAALMRVNELDTEAIASAIWTTTRDLTAEFPAFAARQAGWADVPQMCAHEMDVPGKLGMCIRVTLHVNTEKVQREIRHVYLRGATVLRPEYAVDSLAAATGNR
ncbi:MAG: chorismate mutase [Thermomicrobia bacterium]|nr:chorismate mutase [Thermomicrobia bacterium]